eukprot:TRINITY_DN729_c0_g2_i10.p1 TRINITY_DN729_c0_g2~~TRINITY_DN729_c0_g2_i10.p1  ORF type:complete len:139 (+),score=3.07 TRINITY_DN729_c0_g2_i10:260-676(+)
MVLKILDQFVQISGLKVNRSKSSIIDNSGSGLKFDIPTPQTVQYLLSLPDKYHEIQKLRLSPIGMNHFVNSYILSKSSFWSQCEVPYVSEWLFKKFPLMSSHKSSFPISARGFNICSYCNTIFPRPSRICYPTFDHPG